MRFETSTAHRTKAAGFTLLELIVVIAIVAILFAVVATSLGPQRSTSSRNALALFQSWVAELRAEALSTGETVRMGIIRDGGDGESNLRATLKLRYDPVAEEWIETGGLRALPNNVFFDSSTLASLPTLAHSRNGQSLTLGVIDFHPSGICAQAGTAISLAGALSAEEGEPILDLQTLRTVALTRVGTVPETRPTDPFGEE